jgi:hypothetical protein
VANSGVLKFRKIELIKLIREIQKIQNDCIWPVFLIFHCGISFNQSRHEEESPPTAGGRMGNGCNRQKVLNDGMITTKHKVVSIHPHSFVGGQLIFSADTIAGLRELIQENPAIFLVKSHLHPSRYYHRFMNGRFPEQDLIIDACFESVTAEKARG